MEIKDRLCSQCVFSKQDTSVPDGLWVCDIYHEILLDLRKAVLCTKFIGATHAAKYIIDLNAYAVKLESRIAGLEAEVEDLKPYKYGYSTRKKPKFWEWVIVYYKDHLYFGYFDDDRNWATQDRDNIREGIKRWYPLPVLPEDNSHEPA